MEKLQILKKDDGSSITTKENEIVNEWKNYFDKLLNIDQQKEPITKECQTAEPQVE